MKCNLPNEGSADRKMQIFVPRAESVTRAKSQCTETHFICMQLATGDKPTITTCTDRLADTVYMNIIRFQLHLKKTTEGEQQQVNQQIELAHFSGLTILELTTLPGDCDCDFDERSLIASFLNGRLTVGCWRLLAQHQRFKCLKCF